MGYALFTARKLSLTARVNQMNAQLAIISERQMQLAAQQSQKENAKSMAQYTSNASALSIFKDSLSSLNVKSDSYQNDFQIAQAKYNEALNQSSLDSAMSDTEIQQLSQMENALDIQRKSIETQLQAAQKDLESVEKAEESAIKNATPKYVG